MRLLAFDTTGERLSIALLDGGRRRVRTAKASAEQDEQLTKETERLLRSAKLRLADMDAFAAATGPGRFTGIRVGLTFVGVLAKALGKPAVGVSWLEAAAWKAARGNELVVSVVQGWKGELFFQVFRRDGERPEPLRPPRWSQPAGLAAAVKADLGGRAASLVGPAAPAAAELLGREAPGEEEARRLDAADLLVAAKARLERGSEDPLEPLYIKPAHYEGK